MKYVFVCSNGCFKFFLVSARYNYPNKELATNTKLVERIVRLAKELDREIATPDEAREILALSPHMQSNK